MQRPWRWPESNPGPPIIQKLITVPTQADPHSTLPSHSCVFGCTVLHYGVVFTSHTDGLRLNSLLAKACVRHSELRVRAGTCTVVRLLCVNVMAYWSSPAGAAGPQVRSIKTMGSQSWNHCISQESSDWLLQKKQIAMMANKILTEAMPSSMMGWNRRYFIVIERYWQL